MQWREAKRWKCTRCGECCQAYIVPIKFIEALNYTRKYGEVTIYLKGKYYLTKKSDGSCIFLNKNSSITSCRIYLERPLTCKLYPFHITRKPIKDTDPKDAEININGEKYYCYVDAACPGVGRGYEIKYLIPKIFELWKKYTTLP